MQRIVSICPSNTEILWALGLGENIVGVDDYSDWPEAVHRLPRLGPDLQIDMDQLKSLQPDWVLASLSVPGMEKNIEALQQTDIPFMVLHAGGLEDIPQDFIQVARQAGMEKRGEELAEAFHTRLESIRSRIPRDRPSPASIGNGGPNRCLHPPKKTG